MASHSVVTPLLVRPLCHTMASTPDGLFNQLLSEILIELTFKAFRSAMAVGSTCPHCSKTCQIYRKSERVSELILSLACVR